MISAAVPCRGRRPRAARGSLSWRIAAFLLASLLTAAPARADLPTGRDQAGWDRTAAIGQAWLAENETQQRTHSADDWEDLRLTLTVEKELAHDKAEQGSLNARILLAELTALGPTPAKGAVEPPWVAARRIEFNVQITQAEAPLLEAREAQARAGVLIAEINRVTDRQMRAQLFGRAKSPLEPAFWQEVDADLHSLSLQGWPQETQAARSGWRLLYVVGSIAAGVLAIFAAVFGHRWIFAMERRRRPSPRQHLGFAFLRDIADIALPMLVILSALALLHGAANLLAIPPGLETAIVTAGAIAIYLHWLGRSVFLPSFEPGRVIALPEKAARRAVWIVALLGVVLAAECLVEYAQDLHATPDTLLTLLSLAVVVCAALCLGWLTRTLRTNRILAPAAAQAETPSRHTFDLWPILRILNGVAIATPLLALVGFVVLARDLLTATIYSVAAVFAALFVFRSITRASDILFDHLELKSSPSWHFVPLVFGFFIFLLTAPVIMMLWGVSFNTILSWVLTIKNGVQVGQVHISFGSVLTFSIVFSIGYFLTRWLQQGVRIALFPRLQIDRGGRSAVLTVVGYAGLTLSALAAVTAAGLDLTSLAVVAGALSVGVGFGLQSIVSNFVSGLILLVERPIRVGDWIETGSVSGHVRRIAFRSTYVETFDWQEVIIPNSNLISESVTNLTYGGVEGRISLPFALAYDTDVGAAKAALLTLAKGHPKVITSPAPSLTIDGLKDRAVNVILSCFIDDINDRGLVRSELYVSAIKALRAAGVETPVPQREVTVHSRA